MPGWRKRLSKMSAEPELAALAQASADAASDTVTDVSEKYHPKNLLKATASQATSSTVSAVTVREDEDQSLAPNELNELSKPAEATEAAEAAEADPRNQHDEHDFSNAETRAEDPANVSGVSGEAQQSETVEEGSDISKHTKGSLVPIPEEGYVDLPQPAKAKKSSKTPEAEQTMGSRDASAPTEVADSSRGWGLFKRLNQSREKPRFFTRIAHRVRHVLHQLRTEVVPGATASATAAAAAEETSSISSLTGSGSGSGLEATETRVAAAASEVAQSPATAEPAEAQVTIETNEIEDTGVDVVAEDNNS